MEVATPDTNTVGGLVSGMRRHFFATVLCGVWVWAAATTAHAEPSLGWRDSWRRVGPPEYVVTPALLGGTFLVRYAIPPPTVAFWTSPILFDAVVRDALRRETPEGRNTAATISHVVALASLSHPLVIDSVIVTGLVRDSWDVAWQMEVISVQSYAFTTFVTSVSKRLFARQRPNAVTCAEDPEYSGSCEPEDRYRSFYSGHSALTATSAGLVCAHHTHVPIYGGGWADTGACLGALGLTLFTGGLRVAADVHWATDVITGHLVGFSAGYLIPSLLYYRGFRGKPVDDASVNVNDTASTAAPVVFTWGGEF